MKSFPSFGRLCWGVVLALGSLVLFLCGGVSALGSAPSDDRADFCGPKVVHDYLGPLREMKPVRHVPGSGELSFAPKGVTLSALGTGLQVGPGRIGFGFSDRAVDQRRRLNWSVETALVEVDRSGELRPGVKKHKSTTIGDGEIEESADQSFFVSGRPAFYRVEITIRSRSGASLGRFGEYFRVVRPRLGARLALASDVVGPGGTLLARVENSGTRTVAPSSRARIERFEAIGWTEIAKAADGNMRPLIRMVLFGGEVAPCLRYAIPASQPAGLYRVVEPVAVGPNRQSASDIGLIRQFRVDPEAG